MWYIYGLKVLTQSVIEFKKLNKQGDLKSKDNLNFSFATPYDQKNELEQPILLKKNVKFINNFKFTQMEENSYFPSVGESIKIGNNHIKIINISIDSNSTDLHIFTNFKIYETDNIIIENLTKQLYDEYLKIFVKNIKEMYPEIVDHLNILSCNDYSDKNFLHYINYFSKMSKFCFENSEIKLVKFNHSCEEKKIYEI